MTLWPDLALRPLLVRLAGLGLLLALGAGAVSSSLDASAEIDVATLVLDASPVGSCKRRDVDLDGARELLCKFPSAGIALGGLVCLRGATREGRALLGCDSAQIVP